jgi:hypothetical protein
LRWWKERVRVVEIVLFGLFLEFCRRLVEVFLRLALQPLCLGVFFSELSLHLAELL